MKMRIFNLNEVIRIELKRTKRSMDEIYWKFVLREQLNQVGFFYLRIENVTYLWL